MFSFISTLYEIAGSNLYSDTISWSEDGRCLKIYPNNNFITILTKYFPSYTESTFFRTLRNYGFHKIKELNLKSYEMWRSKHFNKFATDLATFSTTNRKARKLKINTQYVQEMIQLNRTILNELEHCSKSYRILTDNLIDLYLSLGSTKPRVALVYVHSESTIKLSKILYKLQYNCYFAVSYVDAIKRFYEGNIDFIIIEISQSRALFLVLEIRKTVSNCVIFMIGNPISKYTARSFFFTGINEYLCKPISEYCFIELFKKYFINEFQT
ncbi:hypothetical protein H312_02306 [Anncaliia algerae PRA339]|uniref:HSF-type DNA-binding domain-containing protein n=1 Tax=Anncaliia algerae PRA339 TaxID=1288291 RepID=A0A059EZX3_9MICR|nr:hypothetical protein H312_02306 [Anncaliia algerae PRA339]